ncbi:MAG: Multidrug export protein MepA [Tenericutes bacterium ADurb.BinA155]|nr:MAG: Multidrug export protein MepA [Tenericutes bacterium ADurb.BinA155]
MEAKSEMDLTKGNLFWKIPLFALPMAFTSILQLLYTSVDLYSVNKWGGGGSSMSAVGSNGALINLLVTVFVSLSLGANVAIGNAKGAGHREHAQKVLHTSLLVAVITGILVGIFGAIFSRYFLQWMGTNDSIIENATAYLQIYFIGLPFLMVYNYCAQIMRALGDSRRPLYILIISGLINVLFDFIFVYYCRWDVRGVAWATVLCEAVSAILSWMVLALNKKGYIQFHWKEFRFDRESFFEIIKIGLPAGFQGLAFSIPNVLIQSSLYSISSETINNVVIDNNNIVAGSSASGNIEGYIYAMIDAVASACVAFVSQNYGAHNRSHIRKVFWYCQIWMMIFWVITAGAAIGFGKPLLSIFIRDDPQKGIYQEQAIPAGYERLLVLAISYFLDGIMDVCSGYLRGMRYSTPPAIITLCGCTISRIIFLTWFFPSAYFGGFFHTVAWLYAVFPISWILTDLAYLVAILIITPRAFAKINDPHVVSEAVAIDSRDPNSHGGES